MQKVYLQYGNNSGRRIPLAIELSQCREEGKDIAEYSRKAEKIWDITDFKDREAAAKRFLRETYNLPVAESFPYCEPNGYDEILAQLPSKFPTGGRTALADNQIYGKLYGGILGRCAGCLLGKPVEQWSREDIAALLKRMKKESFDDYLLETENTGFEDGTAHLPGKIEHMPFDDDIDYVVLNLLVLENFGKDFTAEDVGECWLNYLSLFSTFSAEQIAYRNIANLVLPPESATSANPYREWIGAQIRADVWGYINPGNMERAAKLAYTDSSISHVKNGIYASMFNAAMIAKAYTTNCIEDIISAALDYVPMKSRLAEAVQDSLLWRKTIPGFESALDRMYEKYGHYSPVHSINNAIVCCLALLYSGGDFEKAISYAVSAGLDTDCNGATVGSVMGILLGAENLPPKWIAPFNDLYQSNISQIGMIKISGIAKRLMQQMNNG